VPERKLESGSPAFWAEVSEELSNLDKAFESHRLRERGRERKFIFHIATALE